MKKYIGTKEVMAEPMLKSVAVANGWARTSMIRLTWQVITYSTTIQMEQLMTVGLQRMFLRSRTSALRHT